MSTVSGVRRSSIALVLSAVVACGDAPADEPSSRPGEPRAPLVAAPSVTRHARAIERAATFFARPQVLTHPEAVIVEQLLLRKFPDVLRYRPDRRQLPGSLGTHELVVRRFLEPNHPMTQETILAHGNPINQMLAAALYCDRIPLPPSYADSLRDMNRMGGLFVTHGVMATGWAVENGCIEPDAVPEDIAVGQLQGLLAIEHAPGARAHDLGVEALACLYYAGRSDVVEEAWVDELVSLQRPDGGFSDGGPDQPSNHHTTALALWVLLEHDYPGRQVPWLPAWPAAR